MEEDEEGRDSSNVIDVHGWRKHFKKNFDLQSFPQLLILCGKIRTVKLEAMHIQVFM